MRTTVLEKSLFRYIPMEYDFLKARFFGLGAALIFSYLEKNRGLLDLNFLSDESKIEKKSLIKRILTLDEKGLILGVGDKNDLGIHKQYKIHNNVLRVNGEKRLRK